MTNETELQQFAENLVRNNVHLCLSGIVATLAQGADQSFTERSSGKALMELCDKAQELCCPIEDCQEAAEQAGWRQATDSSEWYRPAATGDEGPNIVETPCGARHLWADDVQAACSLDGLDPYEWEVFEHWAVSEWLAEKLEAEGERVDRDFEGLCVWGRTTTGQGIAGDSVIRKIAAEILAQ
jgi:hypothetical protein